MRVIQRSKMHASCLLLLAVAATACSDPGLERAEAELWIEHEALDFGAVGIGGSSVLDLPLSNIGSTTLLISEVVIVGEAYPDWFQVSPGRLEVGPRRDAAVTVTFTPFEAAEAEAVLRLVSNDPQTPIREVRLLGSGFAPQVEVGPSQLDFGRVVVGTSRRMEIVLHNHGEGDALVRVREASGFGAGFFHIEAPAGAIDQAFLMPPDEGEVIQVTYAPTEGGIHRPTLIIDPCERCATFAVFLFGEAHDSGLVVTPDDLDFGMARPGVSLSREVLFENIGNVDLEIRALDLGLADEEASPSSAFRLTHDPLPLALHAGDQVRVEVDFLPPDTESHEMRLDWISSDPDNESGTVSIKGQGGAPWIELVPAEVQFGLTAVGYAVGERVAVVNKGQTELNVHEMTLLSDSPFRILDPIPDPIAPGEAGSLNLLFEPTSEGTATGRLRIRSNDPHDPEVEAVLLAEAIDLPPCSLSLAPADIRFGFIEPEKERTRTLVLTNDGESGEDCLVASLDLTEDAAGAFSLVDGPIKGEMLGAGERREVQVSFVPPRAGSFEGALEVYANDPTQPRRTVPMTGASGQSGVLVMPEQIDFGALEVGCGSREREICVYNVGTTQITLWDVQVSGDGAHQAAFSLHRLPSGVGQIGVALQQGGRLCFGVRFQPQETVPHFGQVELLVDALSQPFVVLLEGRGAEDPVQTETFDQVGRPKTDILFVIDSRTPAEWRAPLAEHVPALIAFANDHGVDYHMGVISSTSSNFLGGGILLPLDRSRPHIVHPLLADPVETLRENLLDWMPTEGLQADRRGFHSALKALHPSFLSDPDRNAGFIRPDAHLSIIILSPADDRSQNHCDVDDNIVWDCGTIDFFWQVYASLKPRRPDLLSVHGILDLNGYCYSGPSAHPPVRHSAMVDRTGGHSFSLCNSDFASELQEMAPAAFGYSSRFVLANYPDPDTIEVFILDEDGGRVPAEQWGYDAERNAIVFDPVTVPEPGEQVEVTYVAVCVP